MMTFIYVMSFIYGLATGSFLNACIYRIPINKSLMGRSSCPDCGERIKPYDLFPVLSYFILGGRCRSCKTSISVQYPLVELLTGICFLLVVLQFGVSLDTLKYWLFTAILITMAVIDLKTMEIPNSLVIFGMVTSLIFIRPENWQIALLGGISCFLFLLAIYLISRGGMGEGDVKFALVIGLYLGWPLSQVSLVMAAFIGGLVGVFLLVTKIKKRKDPIPFGPSLAVGAFYTILLGWNTLNWYLVWGGW